MIVILSFAVDYRKLCLVLVDRHGAETYFRVYGTTGFLYVIEAYASYINLHPNYVSLTFNGGTVFPDDTPDTVRISLHFLLATTLPYALLTPDSSNAMPSPRHARNPAQ